MTEPPAVTPSVVAAAERDVLLATKLHVPGPQPGFEPGRGWWRRWMKGSRGG